MKKVTGLEETLSALEEIPKGVDAKLPTYRQMYKAAVGGSLGSSGEESVDFYQLGLKLKIDGNEIVLEDAEFKLLKKACDANPARWTAQFHAQVILKIREFDK